LFGALCKIDGAFWSLRAYKFIGNVDCRLLESMESPSFDLGIEEAALLDAAGVMDGDEPAIAAPFVVALADYAMQHCSSIGPVLNDAIPVVAPLIAHEEIATPVLSETTPPDALLEIRPPIVSNHLIVFRVHLPVGEGLAVQ